MSGVAAAVSWYRGVVYSAYWDIYRATEPAPGCVLQTRIGRERRVEWQDSRGPRWGTKRERETCDGGLRRHGVRGLERGIKTGRKTGSVLDAAGHARDGASYRSHSSSSLLCSAAGPCGGDCMYMCCVPACRRVCRAGGAGRTTRGVLAVLRLVERGVRVRRARVGEECVRRLLAAAERAGAARGGCL